MKRKTLTVLNSALHYTWSLFLSGLFALLPIALTITVFSVSFRILKNWLRPFSPFHDQFLDWIPHVEFIFALIFILIVGLITRLFIIRSVWHSIERLLFKIPIVRPVYSGMRQLVLAFNPHNKVSFKEIVMIQFPRPGIYSLGFLTNDVAEEMAPNNQKVYCSVFIPTTPNPTSGYYVMIAKDELIRVNITQQEAMALIISGGIIQPERFNKAE